MNYTSLLSSRTSDKWRKIGIERRAGVALPLFSIYSKNSVGIGEIPDLKFVIDWCKQVNMSIIQLLPLNEVGYDFAPYSALSTFALEPMYLSIKRLRKTDLKPFRKELRNLKKKFPKGNQLVNYEIKKEKLNLLKKIFESVNLNEITKYKKFVETNQHWLKYYTVFKILTDLNNGKNWQDWELKYKYIAPLTTERIFQTHIREVQFYYWVQWQLFEQFTAVKRYANRHGIYLIGDLPFLVAGNSADVWAYKNYFKLNLSAGAPPDMYFSDGQRWGMPAYNWEHIATDNYSYIRARLKYAENFYDMYRIDHFVGLFRVWTIDIKTPERYGGLIGKFDPEDERSWEDHGRNILSIMNESSSMLPCAEDLGTVPKCSEPVLKEFGVPGTNVQRWEKKLNDHFDFLDSKDYRINSVATVSTHDSSSLPAWWENEAGTIDEIFFKRICKNLNITGEKYDSMIKLLFEERDLNNNRLLWKDDISNVFILLNMLDIKYEEASELIKLYHSSYGEKNKFWNYIGMEKKIEKKASSDFIKKALEKNSCSSSIFCIQLLNEYLYHDKKILKNYGRWDYRINFPGTINKNNWSLIFPVGLEELKELEINGKIKEMNLKFNRV